MAGISTGAKSRPRIEVVAAVIFNSRGEFLLAQRPRGKVYAGYWEFPGGKVEPGEDTLTALKRELHEELGIDVTDAYPWLTRDFDYTHADVRLHFFRVFEWTGVLHGHEQQQFAWQPITNVTVSPLLPANGPILRALELPSAYGITCADDGGVARFYALLEDALSNGLRLVQVREKSMTDRQLLEFVSGIVAIARPYNARVIVNGPLHVAAQAGANGVHLPAARLMTADKRPECDWCGTSCHDAAELERARTLGVDFVVLGPVRATPTHHDAKPMGWTEFRRLAQGYPIPVYALGGMQRSDLENAWHSGAHGVAMVRGAWAGAANARRR